MIMNESKRTFIKAGAALASGLGSMGPLAIQLGALASLAARSADAATVDGSYKALVCLFMHGGNDGQNWLIPTDPTGYAEYANARREMALPSASLLPISTSLQARGRTFGLAPELAPLQKWYGAKKLAFVSNVGPLAAPISKADFAAGRNLPSRLFSHNDQQSTWQSLATEGAHSGWGGRIGDILQSANAYPQFTAMSMAGNAVFLTGNSVNQFQLNPEGPIPIAGITGTSLLGSSTAPGVAKDSVGKANGISPLQEEYARIVQRSMNNSGILGTVLPSAAIVNPAKMPFQLPNGTSSTLDREPLAKQLQMVARLVSAGSQLGMRRQVFFVSISGFDTHTQQLRDHSSLSTRVALSIDYFLTSLAALGLLENVTLFSASDFGRTLQTNGSGTDHGWGNHHLVAGGAVKGGEIFGQFPTVALKSETDVGSGRLLPTTAVNEYAGKLGRWMGLSADELNTVLPNLYRFSSPNLEFV